MRKGFVYALVDPFTDEIRYVGCTVRPEVRFRAHLKYARTKSSTLTQKVKWLRSLGEVEPKLLLLEEVDESDLSNREKAWILKLRAAGAKLTNERVGGKAPRGHKKSEETRAKIRAARAKQVITDDSHRAMSKAQQKRWQQMSSKEREKATRYVAALGRATGATAAAVSHQNWRGRKHSDVSREKMRAAKVGRKVSEQQAQAIREGHQDPGYKEGARERAKRMWANPEYREKMLARRKRKK